MNRPYIAFEGIEGAGKSTVAQRVRERLEVDGHRVVQVREPGGTAVGERIRAVLLGNDLAPEPWTEALLFAAARAQLAAEVVGPALDDGSWVLSDRSVYSSLAYQGAGRGLGIDSVRAVNEPGLLGIWPRLVVLLIVDPGRGIARQAVGDRIGDEGIEFQQAVADGFETLAASEPDRFVTIDAGVALDDVVDAAYRAIRRRW
ncbi:MAG TPA: dTMP kinase [Acidimicrobiia bacterium]|nr:dTMP kinase [Acidimicrobiia bacterium]